MTPSVYDKKYGWEIVDCFFVDDSKNIKECPLYEPDEKNIFSEHPSLCKYAQICDYGSKKILLLSSNFEVTLAYVVEDDNLVNFPIIGDEFYKSLEGNGDLIIDYRNRNRSEITYIGETPEENQYDRSSSTRVINYPAYFDGTKYCYYNAHEITRDEVLEMGAFDEEILQENLSFEEIFCTQYVIRDNGWLYVNVLTTEARFYCTWFELSEDKKWEKLGYDYSFCDFMPGINDNENWICEGYYNQE